MRWKLFHLASVVMDTLLTILGIVVGIISTVVTIISMIVTTKKKK